MLDERIADFAAAAGDEVHDAGRQSCFFEQREESIRDPRRVARRLEHDGVACDDGRGGHPRHDRQREVPRRNHRADAEGDVDEIVVLAFDLRDRLLARVAIRLARVELEEVDGLGRIRVRLGPRLADFERHRGRELVLALAHQRRGFEQHAGANLNRLTLPRLERFPARLDRLLDMLARAALETAKELILVGGVDGVECFQTGDALAADDEWIIAA